MKDEPKNNPKKSWKVKTLFALACLVTLIALFYAEEDWRGYHDWKKYKHEWEAKGGKFDFADIIPAPVPDDENFAMSPVWIARIKFVWWSEPKKAEAWYGDRIYSDEVSKFFSLLPCTPSAVVGTNRGWNLPTPPSVSGQWATARVTDLKPWQFFYRNLEETNPAAHISITPQPQSPAADVLLALSKYDPLFDQLRQDSQRPYSRFPVKYDIDDPAEIMLPHLGALKQCAQVLQLRAVAELQNGQSAQALADVKLMLRLIDSVQTEPFTISHLVGFAMFQITLQPIYEGLANHQWSDAQLLEMDSELSKLDFLADYEHSVRSETAADVKIIQWLEEKRGNYGSLMDLLPDAAKPTMDSLFAIAGVYLMPKGWFYQNDIEGTEINRWKLQPVNDNQQLVSPALVSQVDDKIQSLVSHQTPFNVFARLFVPVANYYEGNFEERTAYTQESADLARVAIALERYRLAHGEYPDALDPLAPQWMPSIPHDVINGEPLHYRRTPNGQFVLYSVGWNATDDGGTIVFKQGSTPELDIAQGDWVWRYPEK